MNEIIEVIESYNEYIRKIPQGVMYIANCLREDQLNEALLTIKDFSEGVRWLSDAFELLKKNDIEVELNIEQIQAFLIEINTSLEKKDFLLVADLFEYEVVPFFENVMLINKAN